MEPVALWTAYRDDESTYAALQTAETLQRLGATPRLFSITPRRVRVDSAWDERVRTQLGALSAWPQQTQLAIWFTQPSFQILTLAHAAGVTNWMFYQWSHRRYDSDVLRAADCVLCPHGSLRRQLPPGLNSYVVPWCAATAHVSAATPAPGFVVYLPAYGGQFDLCGGLEALRMLPELLEDNAITRVILVRGKGWPLWALRHLQRTVVRADGKLEVYTQLASHLHALLAAEAHVAIWAPRSTSFAQPGLNALNSGAPLITWRAAPHTDYVEHERTGVLVDCDSRVLFSGLHENVGSPAALVAVARALARDPARHMELRAKTQQQTSRQNGFWAAWHYLLRLRNEPDRTSA